MHTDQAFRCLLNTANFQNNTTGTLQQHCSGTAFQTGKPLETEVLVTRIKIKKILYLKMLHHLYQSKHPRPPVRSPLHVSMYLSTHFSWDEKVIS